MRTTTLAIITAVAGVAFANGPDGWPRIENCQRVATTDIRGYFVFEANADTGEICDQPQCGGDRAAPNRNQPGCPQYTGTEELVYTARYMAGTPYNNSPEQAPATTTSEAAQSTPAVPQVTAAPVVEEPVDEKPEEEEVMSIQTETSVSFDITTIPATSTSVSSDTATIPATSTSVTTAFQTSTVVMPVAGNSTNGGSASTTGGAKPVESSPAFTAAADKVAMSGLMAGVMAVLVFAI